MNAHALAGLAETLFDEAGDALVLLDPSSEHVVQANPAAQQLTGHSQAQLREFRLTALLRARVPALWRRLRVALRRAGRFDAPEGFTLRRRGGDAWLPVALRVTRVQGEAGPLWLCTPRELRPGRAVEEELRRQQGEMQAMLASVSDCVYSTERGPDGGWHLRYCSPVAERITGRPVGEFAGDPERWLRVVHPEDRPLIEALLARLGRNLSGAEVEHRIQLPDGSYRWVRASAQVRYSETGALRIDGILTDVSERRQAQEALEASQAQVREHYAQLRRLFRATPVGLALIDHQFRYVEVNEPLARINGLPVEEHLGRSVLDVLPPEYAEPALSRLRYVVETGEPLPQCEVRRPGPEGREIVLSVSYYPQHAADGTVRGIYLTAIDMSRHKEAEDQLRGSENKYRNLVETSNDLIWSLDADGRFRFVNRTASLAIYGREPEEMLGRSFTDFEAPEQLARDLETFGRLRQGASVFHHETVHLRKDGTPVHLRFNAVPVHDEAGRFVGATGTAADVTEQRALEAQLQHVQKMDAIGQLAGGLAHDFNNLLTVILGNLSLALSQDGNPGPVQECLRHAERAGLRAADLARTLLGLARQGSLQVLPVALDAVMRETAALLRSPFGPSITIETRCEADLWPVLADPGQINQVLMNLAFNARDAMPDGGRLTIATARFVPDERYLRGHVEARPGEFVRLRVEDTGAGIVPEIRQRIFEPFFTTKERGKGTGLGLAIVFSIVKQHHGWVECSSETGQGTTFDVFLPRHEPTAAPAPAAAPAAVPVPDTILIIDDEPMIRQMARVALEHAGCRILLAEDGRQGVEVYRRHRAEIALVLLDGIMPILSGRDTLRELVQIDPGVRVLFSSGYSPEDISSAEFPQVIDRIGKPYRVSDLTRKVREVLDRLRNS